MDVRKKLLRLAGKGDFELDDSISSAYIFKLCIKYGCMMVRGRLKSLFSRNISNTVFVGRGVKLIEKKKIRIGSKTKIHDLVKIDALSENGVSIGDNCVLGKKCCIECTGSLKKVGKGVFIGNNTTFGSDCYFGAAGGIRIGDDVVAGQNIRFHSENHYFDDLNILIREQGVYHKGIIVGDNCWIGAGTVFLDGAEVGEGCVIGANSVVHGKIPSNCVIAGVPARIIRYRDK